MSAKRVPGAPTVPPSVPPVQQPFFNPMMNPMMNTIMINQQLQMIHYVHQQQMKWRAHQPVLLNLKVGKELKRKHVGEDETKEPAPKRSNTDVSSSEHYTPLVKFDTLTGFQKSHLLMLFHQNGYPTEVVMRRLSDEMNMEYDSIRKFYEDTKNLSHAAI
uniref:Homeobox domain-containing protein n=1 Tax=Caenorhabditis tropicalis TaxID=1561998 RepID=A0A1I7UVD6_9PELO